MKLTMMLIATVLLTLGGGCAAFRHSVREGDPEESSMLGASFDHHDLRNMARAVTGEILQHPFPPPDSEVPIVVSMGIQNRTKTHLDTQALDDTVTTFLMDSGRVRFVDAAQRDALLKEQGYQLAHATDETKVAMGRQLGARYMLTGSFVELGARSGRQVRVSKEQDIYYQLTVTVTDLESGLIVLRKQVERIRRARTPLFGW